MTAPDDMAGLVADNQKFANAARRSLGRCNRKNPTDAAFAEFYESLIVISERNVAALTAAQARIGELEAENTRVMGLLTPSPAEVEAWVHTLDDERDRKLAASQAENARLVEALERIVQHDLNTPGLHYDSLEQLIGSAVGIARAALASSSPSDGPRDPVAWRYEWRMKIMSYDDGAWKEQLSFNKPIEDHRNEYRNAVPLYALHLSTGEA